MKLTGLAQLISIIGSTAFAFRFYQMEPVARDYNQDYGNYLDSFAYNTLENELLDQLNAEPNETGESNIQKRAKLMPWQRMLL